MIVRMKLNPVREHMIYGFFETYIQLTDEKVEKLMKEAELLKNLTISYKKRGVKKVALEMLKRFMQRFYC